MAVENRKQHFVPQYYLRNFSNSGSLYIYDYKQDRIFRNSVSNVAYKDWYYDVDLKLLNKMLKNDPKISSSFVDEMIRKHHEERIAPFINSFNTPAQRMKNKDLRSTLSFIDKFSLTDFVLVQLFRTAKWSLADRVNTILRRDNPEKSDKDFGGAVRAMELLSLFSVLNYPKITNFVEEIEGVLKESQIQYAQLRDDLNNSFTILYMSAGDVNFKTSDSPIGVKWNFEQDPLTFKVASVPITSKIAFLLINRRIFPKFSNAVSMTRIISDYGRQELINLNLLTTYNAQRFLFGPSEDFSEELDFIKGKTKLTLGFPDDMDFLLYIDD